MWSKSSQGSITHSAVVQRSGQAEGKGENFGLWYVSRKPREVWSPTWARQKGKIQRDFNFCEVKNRESMGVEEIVLDIYTQELLSIFWQGVCSWRELKQSRAQVRSSRKMSRHR